MSDTRDAKTNTDQTNNPVLSPADQNKTDIKNDAANQYDSPIKNKPKTFWESACEMTAYEKLTLLVAVLGIGVGIFVYSVYHGQLVEMRKATVAAKSSADIAARSMALANRGYLRIHPGNPSLTGHQSNFPYWLKCEGQTEIQIIRGHARFAAEMNAHVPLDPLPSDLQDHRLDYARWTTPIPATTISPIAIGPSVFDEIIIFPPLTREALTLWDSNKPVVLFLNFDVWYVDAFPETTPLHHLSMNFRWDRQSEGWKPNPVVPSRETDEKQGQSEDQP